MPRRWWRHLRNLWPGATIAAPLPFVAHAVWVLLRGDFHWENGVVLGLVLTLFCWGPRSKKLLIGAYPLGLTGVLYDTMRVGENVGLSPSTIHVCDLRRHELALFGVTMHGERVTLHDWFQTHPAKWLDFACAVPYATFIFVCAACAAWLYVRDYRRMLRFTWCFLLLNLAGFATYHVYPAAPPWYYHAYGCRVDMLARASEGPNLARVDAALHVRYFAGMYGRASDVFGAMPSLHAAYALLVVLLGWAVMSYPWRAAAVAFFALMSFAAVYLDHHWVLDVVAGAAYCLGVVGAVRAFDYLRLMSRSAVEANGVEGAKAPPTGDAPL